MLGRPDGAPPNSPGWAVRVVPNLYPALDRQEVVVHTPRHVRSFAELEDGEVSLVAEAWRSRRATKPDGYLHAIVNEGRFAGASLAHSHSQLVWLPVPPPAVTAEVGRMEELLAGAPVVAETDGLVVAAHPAGRAPYELVIAPTEPPGTRAFADVRLAPALVALRDAVRRLRAIEGPVPWNAWVHDGRWWHVEVLPRLTVLAGLELGAGIHVNVLDPAEAAASLRAAAAK